MKPDRNQAMNVTTVPFEVADDCLVADAPHDLFDAGIYKVWNPSPSVRHDTAPYRTPQTIEIGVRGNELTGAKYSPPPYAVVVTNPKHAGGAMVGVRADAGWHRFNTVSFDATEDRVRVTVDLEGMTPVSEAAKHIHLDVMQGDSGESLHSILTRGLAQQYPTGATTTEPPAWWRQPIYCGWGDQVTSSMWLQGVGPEPRALAMCIQGMYERWTKRLDEARVPFGITTIDAGWSLAGVWEPDAQKWPDLRRFIDAEHERGRKVLLWLATWYHDGLPDEWCVFAGDHKITADPTHPDYIDFITEKVTQLISPDGFDADGFKIDQLAYCPSVRKPSGGPRFGDAIFPEGPLPLRMHGDTFGIELLHKLQKTIYDAAKTAKPDALVTSSTVHPYFADTLDMVRIHDMGHVAPDIFEAMEARIDLAHAALPGKLIDTDDWIHSDYRMWMDYTSNSHTLGVPCIFYAERFMLEWHNEPATQEIPLSDLEQIAAAWQPYVASI